MAEHHTKKLPLPPPKRVLQLETSSYEKKYKECESKGVKGDILESLRIEVFSRKDQFQIGTDSLYEKPADVSRPEKSQLLKLFRSLRGFSWERNFGWIGQDKTMTKQEIKVFEGEVELYDGLTIAHAIVGDSSSPSFVTGVSLSSNL